MAIYSEFVCLLFKGAAGTDGDDGKPGNVGQPVSSVLTLMG